MSPHVVTETRTSLLERRAAVLADLGLTDIGDLRRIAESRTLTSEERDAREELDEICFLLGKDG